MIFKLSIPGVIKSGKNNMMITKYGHHYPQPGWAAWRDEAVYRVKAQWGSREPLKGNLTVSLRYRMADLRRRDVPGMMDALFHVFERSGVVLDDWQFGKSEGASVTWINCGLDKKSPGVEIEITDLDGGGKVPPVCEKG